MKPIIILENPKYSGNVGMICRLVANLDLEPLRIIGNKLESKDEMEWMAYNSKFELDKIQYFENLVDARKDVDVVFGTGMIKGSNRGEILNLHDLNSKISDTNKNFAVLFGREDKGLSNLAVDNSDYMIHFNLSEKQPSMNLANSVAYVLGFYFNQKKADSDLKENFSVPNSLNKLIEKVFDKTEMSKFHNRKNLGVKRLKKILESGISTKNDSDFLYKIFQTIDSRIGNGNENPI